MDDVVAAIADPVRRQILDLLREGPLPARRVAEQFAISRPAVSRHLRVLRECGLVRDVPSGRERHYHLDPAPLISLTTWIADLRDAEARLASPPAEFDDANPGGAGPDPAIAVAWEQRLDALTTEVYRARRDRRRGDTDTDTDIHTGRQENSA